MLLQFCMFIVLLVVITARHNNNNLENGDEQFRECPVIVSREKWKARLPLAKEPMKMPVRYVIIHHTEGVRCHEYENCCEVVRNIQDFHMTSRGWNDIGYTFLIGEDGNIYEGRGWDTIGAHCPGYNNQSLGISIMGNFKEAVPDTSALNAVQILIKCAIQSGRLSPEYILYGHRQGRKGTDCPGKAMFEEIQCWSHWKSGDHFPSDVTKKEYDRSI